MGLNCVHVIVCFLIGFSASASLNIDEMDYNALASLLSDYEEAAGEMEPAINNIPQESNIPQGSNIPKYQETSAAAEAVVGEDRRGVGSGSVGFSIAKPSASVLLAPQVEVLHLIEAFLKLKGEMASRVHALINDNFDLFRSVYNVIMSKISKMHSFTLIGISVIRKIFEFAVQMMATWEVNAPSVSFGFNKN